MTRAEKLAEARRLVETYGEDSTSCVVKTLRLTLDLIETTEDTLPIPTYSAPLDVNDALSPAPDFAAMANEALNAACVENGPQKVARLANWLRANAHRFAKPAPVIVPYAGCEHACWTGGKCRSCGRRDEDVAGDLRVARSMLEEKPAPAVVRLPPRRIPREDDTADVMECVGWNAALDAVEAVRTATPAPAFDVEALAQSIAIALRKKMRGGSMVGYLVTDDQVVNVVRAVAREMLKGGVK